MSRLIVKGLPSRYDDKHLRELFSRAGEVTDAKVAKTKDGKSRQFGFVGFRTTQEAKSARHRLNKTYVDTSRVSVDFAHAIGDTAIPRPWSRYSEGSSRHKKEAQGNEEDFRRAFLRKEANRIERLKAQKQNQKDMMNEKDRAALEEFHDTSRKRASNPVWSDGAVHASTKSTYVPSRKNGGEGKLLERKHVTFNQDDSDREEDALYEDLRDEDIVGKGDGDDDQDVEGERDVVALDEGVSDMDYFKTKVVAEITAEDDVAAPSSSGNHDNEGTPGTDERQSPSFSGSAVASDMKEEVASEHTNGEALATKDTETPREQQKNAEEHSKRDSQDIGEADASVTGRLLVRNLPFSVATEDLEKAFEKYGTLADVHVVKDPKTGQSRGIGFVQFVIPENAPRALVAADGKVHWGRILHVLPARPRPSSLKVHPNPKQHAAPGSSSYKAKREEAQKDAARKGLDGKSQHALHLSSDAVANIAAERFGATKADLYGTGRGESGAAAVRLAMAEAVIQSEAKHYLMEHGIDLEAAENAKVEASAKTVAAKRKRQSRTAFLVKNLPARTTGQQLRAVFSRFGEVRNLIVIPTGLIAVVLYVFASDAKNAYNSLAYTRFRDTPLYLEWLPTNALKDVKNIEKPGPAPPSAATQNDTKGEHGHNNENEAEDIQARVGSVYVKNLNFDTRDASLRSHFLKTLRKRPDIAASLRSVRVALKRNSKGDTKDRLSMGFGFLEFSSVEKAKEAMKIAQNTVLDGHSLQLHLSNQRDEKHESSAKRGRDLPRSGKPGSKLIVRNVAFEATKRDIRQLFSAFGQLKMVRIPKKVDGSHRGFGFIEFVSKDEAKSAFKALSSTHLYGRRLVIEYADEAADGFGSVVALQEKARIQVAKKRIRANDGRPVDTTENKNVEEDADEQAKLQDALYG